MGRKMTLREAIIETLPEEWDDEETRVARWGDVVVVANPKFAPMMYRDGNWEEIKSSGQDFPLTMAGEKSKTCYNTACPNRIEGYINCCAEQEIGAGDNSDWTVENCPKLIKDRREDNACT